MKVFSSELFQYQLSVQLIWYQVLAILFCYLSLDDSRLLEGGTVSYILISNSEPRALALSRSPPMFGKATEWQAQWASWTQVCFQKVNLG